MPLRAPVTVAFGLALVLSVAGTARADDDGPYDEQSGWGMGVEVDPAAGRFSGLKLFGQLGERWMGAWAFFDYQREIIDVDPSTQLRFASAGLGLGVRFSPLPALTGDNQISRIVDLYGDIGGVIGGTGAPGGGSATRAAVVIGAGVDLRFGFLRKSDHFPGIRVSYSYLIVRRPDYLVRHELLIGLCWGDVSRSSDDEYTPWDAWN